MSILGNKYEIFDAVGFAAGLQRAARGLLRVGVQSQTGSGGIGPIASAWLITDTLVVLCDYVLARYANSEAKYLCFPPSDAQPIAAEPVPDLKLGSEGLRPALLRLREPMTDSALTLRFESLDDNDLILIVHHPQGKPQPQLSIGRLTGRDGPWLRYDAATEGGSGGGAILSPHDFGLAGMHVKASRRDFNEGLSLSAMLDVLRESEVWSEIARHHNLADVSAARKSLQVEASGSEPPPAEEPDSTLLSAAVCWNFDPKWFSESERDQLRPLVIDESANLWIMRASERQRVLGLGCSLDELRQLRPKAAGTEIGQQVIDRILAGPPYELDKIDQKELPYWLQAVRWFAGVVPELPTPGDVNRNLERRRIKSRLNSIAGPDFRGREEELKTLRSWYEQPKAGPMVVTGIGGVGKSALVAKFIQLLKDEPLLLWLDFDRADLAPDDAVSVLESVGEQMTVQLENFSIGQINESTWEERAKDIGSALVRTPPPILVLDGFEVAQQVKQHNEIWRVLKLILAAAPELKIIVSGRSPVSDLDLDGREAKQIHLTGIAAEDAREWLRIQGISDSEVRERVIEISEGVPLVLQLALRLIKEGAKLADLPDDLPQVLVKGFLYDRILDRIIDPLLKPVAQDALVLRSLTEKMIPEVLKDRIPEGLTAADVFSRLSLEMGLVGDEGDPRALSVLLPGRSDVLHLRPELRSATLKLLEKDNPERVRIIDQRAVIWYAKQDRTDFAIAAELVYHHLRLGDIKGAEDAWLDGCGLLLMYAADDLPDDAEAQRKWLEGRAVEGGVEDLTRWEKEATERIKSAFSRGLLRVVPDVLKERTERNKKSQLTIYDAWMSWQDGDIAGARARLGPGEEITGPTERDRAALGALFAAHSDDRVEAHRLLDELGNSQYWSDRPSGSLEMLAVQAARIRLAVDLKRELELSVALEEGKLGAGLSSELKRFLTATDVVLPRLTQQLAGTWSYEDVSVSVPLSESELEGFRFQLERERVNERSGAPEPVAPLDADMINAKRPWSAKDLPALNWQTKRPREIELALDLAVLGWRRWRLIMNSMFIAQACYLALPRSGKDDPLSLAIAATLVGFRGYQMSFKGRDMFFHNLDALLQRAGQTKIKVITPHPLPSDRISLAQNILRSDKRQQLSSENEVIEPNVEKKFLIAGSVQGVGFRYFATTIANQFHVNGKATNLPDGSIQVIAEGSESNVEAFRKELESGGAKAKVDKIEETVLLRDYFPRGLMNKVEPPDLFAVLLFLLGPDPLEMLCRRLIGLPDIV